MVLIQNDFFTDFIRPICLSPEEFMTTDFEGYSPSVAGWGATSTTDRTYFSL